MARTSKVLLGQYKPLGPEGEDAKCFYCPNPSVMNDLTPHPKALEVFKASFPEDWTRTRVCRSCWGRIYTANIANGGNRYGVTAGCMTIQHKKDYLRSNNERSEFAKGQFRFNEDRTMIIPSNLVKIEDGPFLYNGKAIHIDELEALQGAMALKFIGIDDRLVDIALKAGLTSDLDLDREGLYREILELDNEVPLW